ncbi:helix-turn-helix domain-containing protein [Nonomuraea dietziae]|uniref:helix-turn-helix domain-containing protein n=1 Tax=Nonomuraea dietziae TaxID=65515 RepID=UPI0033C78D99
MPDKLHDLTPGQRVAWHRVRRGMSQQVLAGLVSRTEDWLSKIENDRAVLDRVSVIRTLADALGVSVFDLIGEPTPNGVRQELPGVDHVRAALMDYRRLSPLLKAIEKDSQAPRIDMLRRDLDEVMTAYQQSYYSRVLRRLPELLSQSQLAISEYDGDQGQTALRIAALANQSAAMLLPKLGHADLAWIAAQRGLALAEQSGDPVIIGSLLRSVIHALHSHDRREDAAAMTRKAAEYLQGELDTSDPGLVSIYGTLLLPGAVASARVGDRSTTREYLTEAKRMATQLGADSNHLWTAFGPTNVKVHQVTTAMSLGDVQIALDLIPHIDTAALPMERRARHSLEVVNAYHVRNKVDQAIDELLAAEKKAPEQIHEHVMSRQLVHRLRSTALGRKSQRLAALARRMKIL